MKKAQTIASTVLVMATLGAAMAPEALAATKKAPAVVATTTVRRAQLLPASGSDEVRGTATLTLNRKTDVLTVLVGASNLAPNSTENVYIESGSSGKVVYRLDSLAATGHKVAVATTTISKVKSIPSGWTVVIEKGIASSATVLARGSVQ